MQNKQRILNRLAMIEDEARQARNRQSDLTQEDIDMRNLFHMIASLTQTIREELV